MNETAALKGRRFCFMILLGVTGGIGAGKSMTCRVLADLGIGHVDTDVLAREHSSAGSDGLAEIVHEFGREVVDASGNLRREQLAGIVFANPDARRRLEGILHPRIAASWRARVVGWREQGTAVAAVIIPLLFEKGYEVEFSRTVSLACTAKTQLARLTARGWGGPEVAGRNASQISMTEKMARADFVVWTEGSVASHRMQWERILTSAAGITTCSPA